MSALAGSEPAVVAFGPFVLDRQRRHLTRDGVALVITPKAFDLLVALVERGGAVVSKETLMSTLWPDTVVEESNLAFQISTLRKALGPEGATYIATIPGRGYQFAAPATPVPAATPALVRKPPITAVIAIAVVVIIAAVAAFLLTRKSAPPPAAPGIHSLAVLPFKPIATAQRDEALELGMADTLITRLSRMPAVVVRPISAVRPYSDLDDDPLDAGRKLGVDAVVDGSIQRRGSRVRVTVRLLRTQDGTPIWATQMDESASDLFAVQDRVAESVARAIVPAFATEQPQKLTDDLEAYELYLKGRYWIWQDPKRAEEFFQRAIARDPKFAAAYAASANGWLYIGRYSNTSPGPRFEKARAAAMKAVELDPNLAEAHVALAQVYADYDWNIAAGEREYRYALQLNPNSDSAHGQYANLLLSKREFDRALFHAQRARGINPLSESHAILYGSVLATSGHYDQAIRHLEETLRAHPKLIPAMLHLAFAYVLAGRPADGVAKLREALAIGADETQFRAAEAWALVRAGDRDAALKIVRELEARSAREPVAAVNLALAWTALGDENRAFQWLERAYERRLYLTRVVITHPGFEPLRDDPRYADLVKRLGF